MFSTGAVEVKTRKSLSAFSSLRLTINSSAPRPVIVSESLLSMEVRGKANDSYQIIVGNSETPVAFETDADGLGVADVTLEPGLNQLCAQVAPDADLNYPEAKNCVNVAYIKP